MKTARILTTTIAALLLAPFAAHAVIETWDGNSPNAGAGDSNISNGLNWADDTAPVSDLINTDLIFAGVTKLAPVFTVPFSTDSVVFNNTAGAFSLGGAQLNVGTTGITNNDSQTQTLTNLVNFAGVANSTVTAASGALTFTNTLTLPGTGLAVSGASATNFANLTGTALVTKTGTGNMTLATTTTVSADFAVNAGRMTLAADGSADVFGSASSIAVNGTSILDIIENLTLDGGLLTRASGASIFLAAGKTLTLQNSADATLTGAFNHQTASTVTLTGAGTTLSATATSTVSDGGIVNVLAGANLQVSTGSLRVGDGTTGTVTVSGGGSAAFVPQIVIGEDGGTGTVTVSNSGLISMTGNTLVGFGSTAGTSGTLNIQSGAFYTTASMTIGNTTLPGSGTVAITGGTLNQVGNLIVNGLLTRDATGEFGVGSGDTMTVQNGGDVQITGAMVFASDGIETITGTGSTLTTTGGALSIQLDNTFNVLAGADVSVGGAFNVANALGLGGTVLVDGAGSTLAATASSTWGVGGTATVTFSNAASATLSGVNLANNATAGSTANVSVLSGATVTSTALTMAQSGVAGNAATLTINGPGSAWTVSGAGTVTVGGAVAPATLTLQNGAAFTSGTGTTTVNATGNVDVTGGTYNSLGNLTLNGGDLTLAPGTTFTLASGRAFNVQAGSVATFNSSGAFAVSSNSITVTGAGSQLVGGPGTDFRINGGSNFSILNGGTLTTGQFIDVGTVAGGVNVLFVDGAGSSVTTGAGGSLWGGGGGTGAVEFANNATGNIGAVFLPNSPTPGSMGTLLIASGADVTMGNLFIASSAGAVTGTATITGPGSTLTLTGTSTFSLGAGSASTATLTVNTGGAFTSGTGAVSLGATGTVNIGGGTVTLLGPILFNNGTINFTSGALSIVSDWSVGSSGLLGPNVTFDATRRMTTTQTTTVDVFQTLTLNGGTLTTGALVNNGTLDFQKGTLAITGAGGFTIGSGALGANVALGSGANLQVTNTATVAAGATLTVNGGVFTAGALNVTGTLRATLGTASVASGTNNSGGRIFIADALDVAGTLTNAAGARITLQDGTGLLSGAGALNNSGLVTGDGTIAKPLTNAATGEVRGELGRTLNFTASALNNGQFNLLGGTLDFAETLTNAAGGLISGHGTLFTAGLTNEGNLAISGGNGDIRGDVTNAAGARIITSGGATTTFFDDVIHNGTEIRTSAGGASVFLGAVSGAGPFTGTGTVYFEGDLRPGNSSAAVLYEGDLVFGGGASLTLEIGGLLSGVQHDHLNVGGALHADGDLVLALLDGFTPQFGDTFDLLDAGTFGGDFDTIIAPALSGGNEWDFSSLKTTGSVTVVPEPGVGMLLCVAAAFFCARLRRDQNPRP